MDVRLLAECTQQRLHAAESLNAFLGCDEAWTRRSAERVAKAVAAGARLPLAGHVLAVKDNIDVDGWPLTAASPVYAGLCSTQTAPAAARLLDAGALLAGKTNMHELAYGVTTDSIAFGAAHNPYALEYTTGGSSGGSAAALAAGLCTLALGTDTGGSVRIPASCCGVVGFRPTTGRYAGGGVVPLSPTRDTIGPLALDVAGVRLADAVLRGMEPIGLQPRPRRLGLVQHWFCELLDPEVGALFEGACATLEASGFTLVPVSLPGMEEHVAACARAIVRHEVFPALCADLGQRGRPMAPAEILARVASPDVKNALRGALDCDPAESARDHAAALTLHRPALAALFAEVFVRHALDALLFPTLPVPPPPLGVNMLEVAGREQAVFGLLVRNVQPASLAALPSISLPMGYTRSGLPVGVELDGAHGQDEALLEVAAAVEAALAVPRRAPLVGFADTP